jgi:hypothetical protein
MRKKHVVFDDFITDDICCNYQLVNSDKFKERCFCAVSST